ncbi:hypothetical protein [Kitasatospora sp. P5_F3]
MAITKKPASATPVAAGESFDYTVTVTNNGPSQASGLVVTDALPVMLKFVSASDGCTATGQDVTCPKLGTLASKAAKAYTITVRLDPAYSGDGSGVRNQAKVATDTADPDLSNNTSDASTGGLPGPGPGPNPPNPVKADVAITKKPASTTPVAPGETFDYTVTVTNNGPSDAKGLVVTDALPASLTFVSSPDGCTASGQDASCPKLATLAAKGSKTFTIKVQLDPAYSGDGSDVRNQAKVATDTSDPDLSNNTSDASTGGLPGPGPGPNPPSPVKADVAITKKPASSAAVAPGETFDYTVTVTNNGPSQASGLVVTDALPSMLKFVLASDSCTATGQDVTCPKLATLAAKGSKTYMITVQLDPAYAGDGSDVRNQAKVATDSADPDLSNNTSDASTGTLPGPGPGPNPPAAVKADVAITKKPASTTPVAPGETFDYTITVTNNGPSDAKGLVVTDALPAALKFVSASDSCTATGQDVSCPRLPTLAAKASKTYTITVQLDPAYSGDGSDVRNQAKVATDSADPDPTNNTSDGSTGTLPGPDPNPPSPVKADVAITKKPGSTAPVAPGETFDYTVTVTNNGPSDAKSLVVTDALPAMLKFVSASDGCTAASQDVTCPKLGTLAAKASKTYRITVQLDPAYAGDGSDVRNQAKVATDSADPDLSNNTSDASTGTLPGPGPGPNPPSPARADVAVTKKPASTAAIAPGESFDYTVTVTNNGPSDAKGLTVTDALPAALKFVSASDSCTATGQDVSCPRLPTLAAKASKTYTITVQLDPAYSGDGSDVRNQAKAATDTTDPDPTNNTSDASTGTLPGPGPNPAKADVAVTKKPVGTKQIAPGETFDYTITVTNNGPAQASDVKTTDALPAPLAFVSSVDGCTAAGQDMTCPALTVLAAKGSRTFTFTVRLDQDYEGDGSDIGNIAKVTAATADPDLSNNSSAAAGLPAGKPRRGEADLAIDKSSIGAAVAAGENVDYKITVTNNGPSSDSYKVVLTDELPKQLTYVSSQPAGCTVDAATGRVTCPAKGRLKVGEKFSYVLTTRLDSSYTGDGSDIVNRAVVHADSTDPNPTNDKDTAPLPDGGRPAPHKRDMAAQAIVSKESVLPGETVALTGRIRNHGPSTHHGEATFAVTLPAELSFAQGLPGHCAVESPQRATCKLPAGILPQPRTGNRAAQDGYVDTEFALRVSPDAVGGQTLTGKVRVSDPIDRLPDNDEDTYTLRIGAAAADLALAKSAGYPAGKTQVDPGDTFTYTLTTTNQGPSTAVNANVTDPLPAALSFVSSPDGCTANGRTVTCGPVARLAPGDKAVHRILVKLDPAYAGNGKDVDNIATAASDTPDPDQSNNSNKPGTNGPDGGPLHTGKAQPLPKPKPLPHTGVAVTVAAAVGTLLVLVGLGCLAFAGRRGRRGRRGPA